MSTRRERIKRAFWACSKGVFRNGGRSTARSSNKQRTTPREKGKRNDRMWWQDLARLDEVLRLLFLPSVLPFTTYKCPENKPRYVSCGFPAPLHFAPPQPYVGLSDSGKCQNCTDCSIAERCGGSSARFVCLDESRIGRALPVRLLAITLSASTTTPVAPRHPFHP